MPRVDYTPTDQAAVATASCSTTSCSQDNVDVATGAGLPVRAGRAVTIFCTMFSAADCDNTDGNGASGSGRAEYSTDGGSGWTEFSGSRASCTCPTISTCSDNVSSTEFSVDLGNLTDMSLVQVRARALASSGSNNNTGDGDAQITAWRLSAHILTGIIGAE